MTETVGTLVSVMAGSPGRNTIHFHSPCTVSAANVKTFHFHLSILITAWLPLKRGRIFYTTTFLFHHSHEVQKKCSLRVNDK